MIYLDNAATTFPKPKSVYEKMDWANRNIAVNAGRGSYKLAREASGLIDETRELLLEVVHSTGYEKAVLTTSATMSLHIILNGIEFNEGDVVYVSPFEHNAVARTLNEISVNRKIVIKELPLMDGTMSIDLEKTKYLFIKDKPKCVCCTHVSNVTGYILPICQIFEAAKIQNAITVLDASQSFGLVNIDVREIYADFIVFAGHKTLYGPIGVAGFIDVAGYKLKTVIAGGTGSDSLNLSMPKESPYCYEAASKDIVAIIGLNQALKVLSQEDNFEKEKELSNYLIERLSGIPEIVLYLPDDKEQHIGVVSFNVEGYKSEDVGSILDEDYDIAVRTGYHCAPYIHRYLLDEKYLGTIRVGFSICNSKEEIDVLVNAIMSLIDG